MVGSWAWASHFCYKLARRVEFRLASELDRSVRVFILGLGQRADRSGVWGFGVSGKRVRVRMLRD